MVSFRTKKTSRFGGASKMTAKPFGLYVHIPFCSKICHYCDFAKTANYSSDHVAAYIDVLCDQLNTWSKIIPESKKFSSVFFGGGTPGLLTHELAPLLTAIQQMSRSNAEVTIEANPTNVSLENVNIWKSLGFNRLSLGVQSFDDAGLKALTRDHSSLEARRALELAAKYFPKSNGDLIYGWPGQTLDSWQHDLDTMLDSGVNHLSLYALTYEGQTPFARAERRGVIEATSGDDLAQFYDAACSLLRRSGFTHDEISNWSLPGKSCDHNWLYWTTDEYVGIGAGAHGFVDDGSPIGLRYHYEGDLRRFLRASGDIGQFDDFGGVIAGTGGAIDQGRDLRSWLLEYVGCGMRSRQGISLDMIASKGFTFRPTYILQRAMDEGLMIAKDGWLTLNEAEWFRETAWSLEACESLTLVSNASESIR